MVRGDGSRRRRGADGLRRRVAATPRRGSSSGCGDGARAETRVVSGSRGRVASRRRAAGSLTVRGEESRRRRGADGPRRRVAATPRRRPSAARAETRLAPASSRRFAPGRRKLDYPRGGGVAATPRPRGCPKREHVSKSREWSRRGRSAARARPRRRRPLPPRSHKKRTGLRAVCWKASRVGERVSPYVAVALATMAVHILLF